MLVRRGGCVCVCGVCVHVCMWVHVCACVYVSACECMCNVCACLCACACMCVCLCVYVCACVYACVYACVGVHTYVCVYHWILVAWSCHKTIDEMTVKTSHATVACQLCLYSSIITCTWPWVANITLSWWSNYTSFSVFLPLPSSFWLLVACKNGGGRPGPFYHVNNVLST